MPLIRTEVTVNDEILARARAFTRHHQMSMSLLVNIALDNFIDQRPQLSGKPWPAAPEDMLHVRESVTPGDLLWASRPDLKGLLEADCSCGGTYTAPAGGDEHAALEAAHEAHVTEMATGC